MESPPLLLRSGVGFSDSSPWFIYFTPLFIQGLRPEPFHFSLD